MSQQQKSYAFSSTIFNHAVASRQLCNFEITSTNAKRKLLNYFCLAINHCISLSHFDEVLKHGRLRSFKYGGDFGITQSVLPTFERNSHIVRQIEAVND